MMMKIIIMQKFIGILRMMSNMKGGVIIKKKKNV